MCNVLFCPTSSSAEYLVARCNAKASTIYISVGSGSSSFLHNPLGDLCGGCCNKVPAGLRIECFLASYLSTKKVSGAIGLIIFFETVYGPVPLRNGQLLIAFFNLLFNVAISIENGSSIINGGVGNSILLDELTFNALFVAARFIVFHK